MSGPGDTKTYDANGVMASVYDSTLRALRISGTGGGGAPTDASYVTMAAESGLSNESVLGTAVIMTGTLGARPAAATAGRLYAATDNGIVYRDTGATWTAITGSSTLALTNAHIYVGDGSNLAADVALSGDATIANTGALTLASAGPGATGPLGTAVRVPVVTIDAKGRVTGLTDIAIALSATGDATGTLPGALTLANSGVSAATYGSATQVAQVALDAKGRATSASNVTIAIPESAVTNLTTDLAGKQPLDSDLTTIAGLTATTDNIIQSVGSAWASRTPAQVKAALVIAESDVTNLVTDLAAKQSTTLTSAHLLVGSGSNVATDVALSGDATLANTGALTIANLAVTNAKIAAATIDLTTKVTGALPIANGGTAATSVPTAKTNLKLGYAARIFSAGSFR